ncbi:MAG: ribosome biogenesis GTP-binding protein YihA/YsxC [Bacteroidia bacterium]
MCAPHSRRAVVEEYEVGAPLPNRPLLALSGRSNVGKSTLLNRILGQKVAPVSRQPGCTRRIRLYGLREGWIWADLPGYGYAAVAQTQRQRWQAQIQAFLRAYRPLVAVLVDSRLPPQPLDISWCQRLDRLGLTYLVLATKVDKLTQKHRHLRQRQLTEAFPKAQSLFFVSARSGEGLNPFLAWLKERLREFHERNQL